VGKAIQNAVRESGLHPGVFSLVFGHDNSVGEALVDHPLVQAVGFTGSEAGGMALVRRGAQRPNPILVFAEMTSTNPNFVLPARLSGRAVEFAKTFVQQMTAGVGQMCLKPGMIVAIEGDGYEELRYALKDALSVQKAEAMLSPGIYGNFTHAVERTRHQANAVQIAKGQESVGKFEAFAEIFEIQAEELLRRPNLGDEMFGPAAVLVRCSTETDMLDVARSLKGQLTVALHVEESDQPLAQRILPIITRKAGRILANKFANMVEISHASIHGGPFPATSDSRFTSVGATAIERFLRPVCYDNMPAALLPPALQDSNPLGVWRLRDGSLMQA
jgi:NADP-dependent aldehyde dehydrogenase